MCTRSFFFLLPEGCQQNTTLFEWLQRLHRNTVPYVRLSVILQSVSPPRLRSSFAYQARKFEPLDSIGRVHCTWTEAELNSAPSLACMHERSYVTCCSWGHRLWRGKPTYQTITESTKMKWQKSVKINASTWSLKPLLYSKQQLSRCIAKGIASSLWFEVDFWKHIPEK